MFLPIPESVTYCNAGTQTEEPGNPASLLDISLETIIECGLDTPLSADPVQSVPTIRPSFYVSQLLPKLIAANVVKMMIGPLSMNLLGPLLPLMTNVSHQTVPSGRILSSLNSKEVVF